MRNTNKPMRKIPNLCDWSSIEYPIFSYQKENKSLKNEINNISKIFNSISALVEKKEEINTTLSEIGCRLNFTINNLFHCYPKFNYKKHFLKISCSSLEIHDNYELDNAIIKSELEMIPIEDQDELFDIIPPGNRVYKANKEKLKICEDLSKEYNIKYAEFEICVERIDVLTNLYNQLLETIKYELCDLPIINITRGELETFDDNLHDIITIKTNDKIELFYTRKENRDDFLDTIFKEQ